jgi:lysozyme
MALIDRIRQHEGIRLTVYDDATSKPIQAGSHVIGNPTIGIGTLICAPGGITNAEAEMLLANRVHIATVAAKRLAPSLIDDEPERFDVLVEMCFQIGMNGVAKFTSTLNAINQRRWKDAADGMLASLWAKQTPGRANELAQVMRTGKA